MLGWQIVTIFITGKIYIHLIISINFKIYDYVIETFSNYNYYNIKEKNNKIITCLLSTLTILAAFNTKIQSIRRYIFYECFYMLPNNYKISTQAKTKDRKESLKTNIKC